MLGASLLQTVSSINAEGPLWIFHNTKLPRKVRHVFGKAYFISLNYYFMIYSMQPHNLACNWVYFDRTINGAKIQDVKFILGLNDKQYTLSSFFFFLFVSWIQGSSLFPRYIRDMALVRKHVVTLTFPNLGKMIQWPTVRPAVHLLLSPFL